VLRHNVSMFRDRSIPNEWHVWTLAERMAQLVEFENLCEGMARLFAANADQESAGALRAAAAQARMLGADGFVQADLNDLGGSYPPGPWWLNPKAMDYNAPRAAWQDEVARMHSAAWEVAINLRSLATLEQP
jgi:hypothetical protein